MAKIGRKTKRKYVPSITNKRKTRKKTKHKRKLLNKRKITKYRRNKMKGGMEGDAAGDAAAAAGAAAAESAVPDVKYIDSKGNEYGNEEEDLMKFLTDINLLRYNDKLKKKGINTISQLMEHIGDDEVLGFMRPPHMEKLNEILKRLKVLIQKLEFIDSDGDKIKMYKITMYKNGKSYIDLYINDVLTHNNILLKNIVTKKPKGYGKRVDAARRALVWARCLLRPDASSTVQDGTGTRNELTELPTELVVRIGELLVHPPGFTFIILGSAGFGGADGLEFTLYGSEDEKREIKARLIEFLKEK